MKKSELAKRLRIFISIGVKLYSLFSEKSLQRQFDRSKYCTGYIGLFKRYCIVKNLATSCGENVAIFDNVVINNIKNMRIGNNVAFNTGVYIDAYSGINIGDEVGLSQGVSIFTTNHMFDRLDVPHTLQGLEQAAVTIGNDVWIGSKSTILMGTQIGDGCVIGAGAVVTKNLPPYSVSVGVPAKVIRMRK